MGKVKKRRRFKRYAIEFGVAFAIGFVANLAMLASVLIGSHGMHPFGACDIVVGSGGLLPTDPFGPKPWDMTCNPNFPLFWLYLFVPALIISIVLFLLIRLFGLVFRVRRSVDPD